MHSMKFQVQQPAGNPWATSSFMIHSKKPTAHNKNKKGKTPGEQNLRDFSQPCE
jgi:hypothetical protein